MSISLAADLMVSFLLFITIVYAAKLSFRLNAFRADKAALQALVEGLAAAAHGAEAGVRGLKTAAEEIGRQLDGKVRDAQSLRDDLAYMVDRGGDVADRLEGALRSGREPRSGAGNPIHEMASRLASGAPSRAERDLLRALAGRR